LPSFLKGGICIVYVVLSQTDRYNEQDTIEKGAVYMNVFKQLYVSLYSPKDIATFRYQGLGKTIFFVFVLSLLSILPASYYFSMMIKDSIYAVKQTVSTEIPAFEIKDGKLKIESDEPIIIHKEGFTIFIDDSGILTPSKVANQTTNGLAFLQSEFVVISAGNAQSSPYTFIEGNNETISSWLDKADRLLWIFLSIMIFIFYIIAAVILFIKITIFSIFGLVLKNAFRKPLRYRQVWTITAYCVTLPTIFFTIMDFFQATVPFSMSLNWFIIFILLFLTLKEIPHEQEQEQ